MTHFDFFFFFLNHPSDYCVENRLLVLEGESVC